MSGPATEYCGFLTKKGAKFKTWKRRYFVLQDNCLSYFVSEQETVPIGVLFLSESTRLGVDERDKQANGESKFFFWIQVDKSRTGEEMHQNRKYIFVADSKLMRDQWIEKLSKCLEKIRLNAASIRLSSRVDTETLQQQTFREPRRSMSDDVAVLFSGYQSPLVPEIYRRFVRAGLGVQLFGVFPDEDSIRQCATFLRKTYPMLLYDFDPDFLEICRRISVHQLDTNTFRKQLSCDIFPNCAGGRQFSV